jgi:serine/threonine-protein kinase
MPQYVAGVVMPVLSRYDIPLRSDSILGKGGMGVVLKATDRLLDREVAIKTINPQFVVHGDSQVEVEHRLFFREAMAHARLGILHPDKILPVNNYGIEDDTPFMELELVCGGSLEDRINAAKRERRRGSLFEEAIIRQMCNDICESLNVLHTAKVYHSDLKPGNVLFSESDTWRLRIADLGLARIAESGFLTKAGVDTFAGGTRNYTPQKVVEGTERASARTDIYSVGVILFELLVGEPLQWGQARLNFVESHSALSSGAKDVIKRACQLLSRNNFSTVAAFQECLRKTTSLL